MSSATSGRTCSTIPPSAATSARCWAGEAPYSASRVRPLSELVAQGFETEVDELPVRLASTLVRAQALDGRAPPGE